MKSIFRTMSLIVVLVAVASPLFAQNPKIAIRYNIDGNCVKGALANITAATIQVKYVELWIYDQKTCKRICAKRKVINTRVKTCDNIDFNICCDLPKADGYIYYVRVTHSGGVNEQWIIT